MKVRVPKKYQHLIGEDSIDKFAKNDFAVWLNYGYCYDHPDSESHTRGYDSVKDAIEDLVNTYDCNCKWCADKPKGTVVKLG